MKKDSSWLLHEKYFKLTNKNIEVFLRDGRSIKGVFVGFFLHGADSDEPSISKWHIVDEQASFSWGVDGLGNTRGEIIRQRAIAQIHFQEDNSTMIF
jgi:fibronectin type 3 domain-containing protein